MPIVDGIWLGQQALWDRWQLELMRACMHVHKGRCPLWMVFGLASKLCGTGG